MTCQSWITFPTLLQATVYWLEDQHGAMALLHLYLVVLCTLDLEKAQAVGRWPGDVTVLVRYIHQNMLTILKEKVHTMWTNMMNYWPLTESFKKLLPFEQIRIVKKCS